MENHSEKGLKTLEMLNTKPEDWGLVQIKWIKEDRMMPVKVRCETCFGTGEATFENGKLALNKVDSKKDYDKWQVRAQELHRLRYIPGGKGKCPTCPAMRKHPSYGTGEVTKFKKMKVWIGYPQWEEKTMFWSRFNHDADRCQLCNKLIKESGFVAVQGKDKEDNNLGMYVGEDCARKFFGIAKWKKDSTSYLKERS